MSSRRKADPRTGLPYVNKPPLRDATGMEKEGGAEDEEEDVILASNDSSLVTKYDGGMLVHSDPTALVADPSTSPVVRDTDDLILGKSELIIPGLNSVIMTASTVTPTVPGPPPSSVVVPTPSESPHRVSTDEDLPLSFTPRNSSSPKDHEDDDIEGSGGILEDEVIVPTLELPHSTTVGGGSGGFTYVLDAPTACKFRKNEDPLTYINKDLFYGLSLEFHRTPEVPTSFVRGSTATSVVLMDFREQESREEALKTWSFWHSRQHSDEIRILDVESNITSGLIGTPTDCAYNAISVRWTPDQGNAYIMIAVRCLSTDFSIQKGIKGIPLQLQIDTSDETGCLISRAVCQVKVFCDKGAERKTREDLKRFVRELEKNNGSTLEYCREGQPRSLFKPSEDLSSKPLLFHPNRISDPQRIRSIVHSSGSEDISLLTSSDCVESVSPKRRRLSFRTEGTDLTRIMIYVRQENEDIFTALHVHPPSVFGLIQAISAKYQIDFGNIRHLYRRDLRGIVVKIDDDMLKYYCNEDAFLMKVLAFEEKNTQSTVHDIVLVDLKTSLPENGNEQSQQQLETDDNNNNPDGSNSQVDNS